MSTSIISVFSQNLTNLFGARKENNSKVQRLAETVKNVFNTMFFGRFAGTVGSSLVFGGVLAYYGVPYSDIPIIIGKVVVAGALGIVIAGGIIAGLGEKLKNSKVQRLAETVNNVFNSAFSGPFAGTFGSVLVFGSVLAYNRV